VKFKLHLFEHPYASANMADSLGCDAHSALAREAVRKSLVLLKNNGNLLPLSKQNGKILVAGPKASDIGSQCGGWTITWQGSTGQITTGTTIYNAVKSVRGSENVVYSSTGSTTTTVDYAIIVVGEKPYAEGQGDSPNPQLTATDLNVIANVKQLNIPYVILLLSGRPMILDTVINDADAFVACWLPGTEALGITDVLFGDYDFSGKLSQTWPSSISQEPINWGDSPYAPLFPYGFGPTYAQNGVPSPGEMPFSIYPDPANDVITIKSELPGKVEIYDYSGKLILKREIDDHNSRIDIREFPIGVFIVVFTDESGVYRRKFVKV
jgi:beta-glucosidase